MAYAYNLSAWEAEAGELLQAGSQLGIHSDTYSDPPEENHEEKGDRILESTFIFSSCKKI